MPFEPRLFRDDDDPRSQPAADALRGDHAAESLFAGEIELELAPELAALGEQLSDDAEHLAGCYPAGHVSRFACEPESHKVARRNRRIVRWGGSAAALLIGLIGWQIVAGRLNDGNRPASNTVSINTPPIIESDSSIAGPKPILGVGELPAAVFRGLSGAEQEAVLDLMQDGQQGRGQLSI